ncbi:CPBP family intramembrane glutamic endopeptidase, partial [Pseudoclavibacter terrae]
MSDIRHPKSVPRMIWVGLAAVAFYVLLAAVGGNLLSVFADGDETLDFALSHLLVLPILITVGVLFTRRAGWTRDVWTAPSPFTERRRWWMLAIPVVLTVQVVVLLMGVPWSEQTVSVVLIYLIGSLLIGIGEEIYFRGILRVTVLGHHRELAALLITSFAFGFAHVVSYLFEDLGIFTIALNTLAVALDGALFYGAYRATGTLWVPILLHGLGDFGRFLQPGSNGATHAAMSTGDTIASLTLIIGAALALALVVSLARQDHRSRRGSRSTPSP